MNLGGKKNQLLFINQLMDSNPKYILTGGTYSKIGNMKNDQSYRLSAKERFPYIEKYINENYKMFKRVEGWNILINNNS